MCQGRGNPYTSNFQYYCPNGDVVILFGEEVRIEQKNAPRGADFTVDPHLPDGLNIHRKIGRISGTPAAETPNTVYHITAKAGKKEVSCKVVFNVTNSLSKSFAFCCLPADAQPEIEELKNQVMLDVSADLVKEHKEEAETEKKSKKRKSVSDAKQAKEAARSASRAAPDLEESAKKAAEKEEARRLSLANAQKMTSYRVKNIEDSGSDIRVGEEVRLHLENAWLNAEYAVYPALPPGLELDPSSGDIYGVPEVANDGGVYTITATRDGEVVQASTIAFNIGKEGTREPTMFMVTQAVEAMPTESQKGTKTSTEKKNRASHNPRSAGRTSKQGPLFANFAYKLIDAEGVFKGIPVRMEPANAPPKGLGHYAIDPLLPPGLAIHKSTGVISGSCMVFASRQFYKVTVVTAEGLYGADLFFGVSRPGNPSLWMSSPATTIDKDASGKPKGQKPSPVVVGGFEYMLAEGSGVEAGTYAELLPEGLPQGATDFEVDEPLPDGLRLDRKTGKILGVATGTAKTKTYTITGMINGERYGSKLFFNVVEDGNEENVCLSRPLKATKEDKKKSKKSTSEGKSKGAVGKSKSIEHDADTNINFPKGRGGRDDEYDEDIVGGRTSRYDNDENYDLPHGRSASRRGGDEHTRRRGHERERHDHRRGVELAMRRTMSRHAEETLRREREDDLMDMKSMRSMTSRKSRVSMDGGDFDRVRSMKSVKSMGSRVDGPDGEHFMSRSLSRTGPRGRQVYDHDDRDDFDDRRDYGRSQHGYDDRRNHSQRPGIHVAAPPDGGPPKMSRTGSMRSGPPTASSTRALLQKKQFPNSDGKQVNTKGFEYILADGAEGVFVGIRTRLAPFGAPDNATFFVAPDLPQGLQMNPRSGAIVGKSLGPAKQTTYHIYATSKGLISGSKLSFNIVYQDEVPICMTRPMNPPKNDDEVSSRASSVSPQVSNRSGRSGRYDASNGDSSHSPAPWNKQMNYNNRPGKDYDDISFGSPVDAVPSRSQLQSRNRSQPPPTHSRREEHLNYGRPRGASVITEQLFQNIGSSQGGLVGEDAESSAEADSLDDFLYTVGKPGKLVVGTQVRIRPTIDRRDCHFSVDNLLPAGLTLNERTGEISGLFEEPSPHEFYIISAVSASGEKGGCELFFNVAQGPGMPFSFVSRGIIESVPEQDRGVIVKPNARSHGFAYKLNGSSGIKVKRPVKIGPSVSANGAQFTAEWKLPFGLNLESSTGIISGSPLEPCKRRLYRIVATRSGGQAAASELYFGIAESNAPSGSFTSRKLVLDGFLYVAWDGSKGLQLNRPVVLVPQEWPEGSTFSPETPLPPGLTLDSYTGVIHGTPTAVCSRNIYRVAARSDKHVWMSEVEFNVARSSKEEQFFQARRMVSGRALHTGIGGQIDREFHYVSPNSDKIVSMAVGEFVCIIPVNAPAHATYCAQTVLPTGLRLDSRTGVLSGFPTEARKFHASIIAITSQTTAIAEIDHTISSH